MHKSSNVPLFLGYSEFLLLYACSVNVPAIKTFNEQWIDSDPHCHTTRVPRGNNICTGTTPPFVLHLPLNLFKCSTDMHHQPFSNIYLSPFYLLLLCILKLPWFIFSIFLCFLLPLLLSSWLAISHQQCAKLIFLPGFCLPIFFWRTPPSASSCFKNHRCKVVLVFHGLLHQFQVSSLLRLL
jgi:hypothetical protein